MVPRCNTQIRSVSCSVHMHEHEINYASNLISTWWIFLCVDGITNSSNIMEDLAMHQLVGLLPCKYILLPMQVVMVMCYAPINIMPHYPPPGQCRG